jgi:hypothetical protein
MGMDPDIIFAAVDPDTIIAEVCFWHAEEDEMSNCCVLQLKGFETCLFQSAAPPLQTADLG